MFKLHFTNFGYCSNEMPTLDAAKAEAIRCGFDCCVLENGVAIGTWSIFSGYIPLRTYGYKPETWAVERE